MNILTHDETAKVIRALHQWLASQGIERETWGPILAKAAGHEVYHYKGDRNVGLSILGLAMRLYAMEDLIYDKDRP